MAHNKVEKRGAQLYANMDAVIQELEVRLNGKEQASTYN